MDSMWTAWLQLTADWFKQFLQVRAKMNNLIKAELIRDATDLQKMWSIDYSFTIRRTGVSNGIVFSNFIVLRLNY